MAKNIDEKARLLEKITKVLRKKFHPSRLFFFGPAANSDHPGTEYDFVLVTKKSRDDYLSQMKKSRELIERKCGVHVEIFIYSEKEFDEWAKHFSSTPERALHTGIEIDLASGDG